METAIVERLATRTRTGDGLSAAWWAVVVRFLLHGLIVSTWVSCIPAAQTSLKLSNGGLGLCLLGTAIGSVLAIPVTGWMVSRFGSRRLTSFSTIAFALSLIGLSVAWSPVALFVALVLFGACAGANDVSINAQGVATERALGEPTMSRFHAMFSIGGMIGASIGGLLAASELSPAWHLRLGSILFLLIAVVTAPWLLDAQEQRESEGNTHSRKISISRLPSVLFVLATIGFCLFLSEGAMADWTGVYLKQVLHSSPALAAAGYAVFSTGMAVFRLLGDAITARLGSVRTVRSGALLAAGGLTLALLSPTAGFALAGFAVTGAGFSVIVPLVFGAGGRVASVPPGVGIATVSGLGYIGFLFGPPVIGLVAQHSSLRAALTLLVVLSVLAAWMARAIGSVEAQEA
jgi:predicted MFS family arabinose efflux permease